MTDEQKFFLNTKEIKANFLYNPHDSFNIIKINKSFILLNHKTETEKDEIKIYDIKSLSFIGSIIKDSIKFFNFHKHFEAILFICVEKNVMIYYIDKQNKKVKEISIIKGHFMNVKYADFSPFDSHILFSLSQNNDIKIYDITKSLPKSHIFINEHLENKIKIKWLINDMIIFSGNKILIFNYINFVKEFLQKIDLDEDIIDLHNLEGNKNIVPSIILTEKDIKYYLDKDNIKSIYKINNKFYHNFFNQEHKVLTIFYVDEIIGLSIIYSTVTQIFRFNKDFYRVDYPIYIYEENLLEQNELFKFYSIKNYQIYVYSIVEKNSNINKIIINKKKDETIDTFSNNIKDKISDIYLLLSKDNNINEENYIINKKYFEYPEIKEELEKIKKRNLFQRKEEVKNSLNKIDTKNNICEKYIFILKLLVNDNTNESLIFEYLNFLKQNRRTIKKYFNIENDEYKNELNYYVNILNVEVSFNKFDKIKISKKDELFSFFDDLLKFNKNKIDEFENFIKSFENFNKNIFYYNMPINFETEELCYYRYIILIKYYLRIIYIKQKEKEDNKKNNANNENEENENEENENDIILKNELELLQHKVKKSKDYIKNNPTNSEKIEYLIILFLQTIDEKEFNFGYNLINTKTKDDGELKNIEKNNQINNIKHYKYLCESNKGLYSDDLYFSKKIYNYDYYKLKYQEKYKLSLVKNFLKKILPLKCFESIYSTLYGNEYYPFKDQNFTDNFIDKYFNFIPLKNGKGYGMTDKFSMKMFIVSFLPKAIGGENIKKSEQSILREGLIINISNHEIGHNFFNNHFYMKNARIPIETPRKKGLDNSEGGYYIEYALYGRELETINLEQALYILNENNYKKSFLEFQEGFNNIQKKDIIIEGIFKELVENINLNEHKLAVNKNIYIPLNPIKFKEKIIICKLKNDSLGGRISGKI